MSRSIIVCPTDPSTGTRRVIAQAVVLAKARHAELHFLQVPRERDGRRSPADEEEDVHPVIADAIESTLADLLRRGEHIRHRIKAQRGSPDRAVAAYARRKRARLIVLRAGYAARGGLAGTPVARSLGRTASCPVLVLPEAARRPAVPRASFREVVCAMDLRRVSVLALQAVVAFVPHTGGRITLVHALRDAARGMVFSGSEAGQLAHKYERQAAATSGRLLRQVPVRVLKRCRVELSVGSGVPHRRILNIASEKGADLIVMGLPSRGRLAEAVGGSTSRAVLRRAKCPVLLVPAVA
jgi:nucleotide-binding universal stress UspA family protein